MADRYWVGGSGTWNTSSTTNWSATSGGAGGASVPTVADNVFFDQAATYTVTMTGALNCLNITVSAGTVTFANGTSPTLNVRGSMTLVAGTVWSATGDITFSATTAGQTITTNGTTISAAITFSGTGGVWTLGSALTTTSTITVNLGHLNTSTSNYSITAARISAAASSNVTLTLNASTVTLSSTTPWTFNSPGTLSAGTSTINITSAAGCTFTGGSRTYYNVAFTGAPTLATHTVNINDSNTFTNLSFTSPSTEVTYTVDFKAPQTITGTFSGSGSQVNKRILYTATVFSPYNPQTITLGSPATISNADFRNLAFATSTVNATTGGSDCGNNSGITFPAPKTVYWNLAGSNTWWSNGWASTPSGTPDISNYPLAQDTAAFTDSGAVTSIILNDATKTIGTIDMSARTLAMTVNLAATTKICGSWYNGAGTTFSGTGSISFFGRAGSPNYISGNGVTFTNDIISTDKITNITLLSNVTLTSARGVSLARGTLSLGSYTLTTGTFSGTNTDNPVTYPLIAFGTGNITLIGSGTVFSAGNMLQMNGSRTVNIAYTGASSVLYNHAGSVNETWCADVNVTVGTYTLSIGNSTVRSIDFTGYSGSLEKLPFTIYGSLTISPTMTMIPGSGNTILFGSSSATPRTITTSGKTLAFNVTFNGNGGSWVLQDAFTSGSSNTLTLTAGKLVLNDKTYTTGSFTTTTNSNNKEIDFGTSGNITLLTTGTVWSVSSTAALTFSGSGPKDVNLTYSGTSAVTINTATVSFANACSFNVKAGTYQFNASSAFVKNLNFTGFSGTLNFGTRTIFGDLTLSPTMTVVSTTSATTFGAVGTSQTITTNGRLMDLPITFNGVGGTFILNDALNAGTTNSTVTLTNGTLDLNGKTFTARSFTTATGTKSILFDTGTLVLTNSGNVFNNAAPTGFTNSAGTGAGLISLTSASAKTFVGAGVTYNCAVNQGGAGALTITGSNTFTSIRNTVQPATVLFTSGTTTTFTEGFSLSGTSGNKITIGSTTTTPHTLSKASGTINVKHCNISYSTATGGATWNAFTSRGNIDGGNNTGWIFEGGQLPSVNFMQFFSEP